MSQKLLLVGLALLSFNAFCQNTLREQSNNFSSAGGQLSTNTTHRLFSVVGQPIAVSNIPRSQTQAGYLQATDVVIADATPPVITPSANAKIISKQPPHGTISATITDNIDIVKVTSTRIRYRKIAEATWSEAPLSQEGTTSTYSVAVQSGWFDAMGIEYFFKATDAAGNSDSTDSYYAYTTSTEELVPNSRIGFVSSGIGKASDYRIFAFPYTTQNNDFRSLFEELEGNPNNNTKWRLARYNNQKTPPDFEDFPQFRNLERGEGYWILVKNSAVTLTVGPVEPFAENRSDLYEMTIRPGWNLIGNPYPVAIDWNDARALDTNPPLSVFYKWDGSGSYKADDQEIAAYEGGFVMFNGASPVTIKIPFFGQTMEGGRLSNLFSNDVSEDAWLVHLKIGQQDQFNELGGFGMHPAASASSDEFDNFNPPAFLNAPEINFPHPEHTLGSFARDIIPSQSEGIWQFTAKGQPGHATELVWDNDLGSGKEELFLLDESTLNVIDMKSVNTYSFTLAKNHAFRIFYGKDLARKISLPVLAMAAPFPNPVQLEHEVSFRLALPDQSSQYVVTFELHDGKGAVVNTSTHTFSPGVRELKSLLNSYTINPGMFYYRVRINGTGNQKTFTGKLIVQ